MYVCDWKRYSECLNTKQRAVLTSIEIQSLFFLYISKHVPSRPDISDPFILFLLTVTEGCNIIYLLFRMER